MLALVYIQALSSLCWRFPPLLPVNLNTLNPSGVDAVIVDLDGTMVDTMGDFNEALNRMLRDLSLPPLPPIRPRAWWARGSEHCCVQC